jgi:hypothetical protein
MALAIAALFLVLRPNGSVVGIAMLRLPGLLGKAGRMSVTLCLPFTLTFSGFGASVIRNDDHPDRDQQHNK